MRLTGLYTAVLSLFRGADQMSRTDRERWAAARTWRDLGELTALWLEGGIASQPGYCGPGDVDEDDAPGLTATLALLNRAGFITRSSQAGADDTGYDGAHWQQYAAVTGFVRLADLDWLAPAVADTPGLWLTVCRPARRLGWVPVEPVTFRDGRPVTDFGNVMPEADIRDDWTGFGMCHPALVDALANAYQIVILDTEFGRNDRLWPALRAAAEQELTRP